MSNGAESKSRRSHPTSDTSHNRDGVDTGELTADDAVVIDRSIGDGDVRARTCATVVAINEYGRRGICASYSLGGSRGGEIHQ